MADYCPFLIIFRGDDTNHELNKSIRFVMTDSGYSLDGMTLHFLFLGVDKEFSNFDPERSCEATFTAEETKQFPVGISFATLYLIDESGKKHTLTTTLPVKITLSAEEAYNGLDIPVQFPMWNIKCCCHDSSTPEGGGGGGSTINIDIVPPDSNAKEGEAADAKSTYEALSRKQDSLSPKQVSAVDSGITKEKVTKLDGIDLSPYAKTSDVLPRYQFVSAAIADGTLTLTPFSRNVYAGNTAAFTVLMDGGSPNYLRDCVFVVTAGVTAPNISWGEVDGQKFAPRTDAATDMEIAANTTKVFWVTEYAEDKFAVAGWEVPSVSE